MESFTENFVPRFFLALLLSFAVVCALDALDFYTSNSESRWYPHQWWKAPFTHAILALHSGHEYWTHNAIGSERWLVREVQLGRVVFWTALERQPV